MLQGISIFYHQLQELTHALQSLDLHKGCSFQWQSTLEFYYHNITIRVDYREARDSSSSLWLQLERNFLYIIHLRHTLPSLWSHHSLV